MKVKMFDLYRAGRAVPLLCDDDGEILPGQIRTVLDSGSPNEAATLTVTFRIDGNNIRSE